MTGMQRTYDLCSAEGSVTGGSTVTIFQGYPQGSVK